jgi:hypothetical protein
VRHLAEIGICDHLLQRIAAQVAKL